MKTKAETRARENKWKMARRKHLQMVVQAIRDKTACAECGGRTIDFHRKEHEEHPEWRICNLVHRAASLKIILEEIARCTPLCRRCHLKHDGRIENIRQKAEGHWNSRLTLEDVAAIRASKHLGTELAKQFGVRTSQISRIRLGQRWKTE